MNKIGHVAIVVTLVVVVYLILLVVIPFLADVTLTTNTTIASSGVNVSAMPGSTEILILSPWFLWFAPGVIGMVVIIIILKSIILKSPSA